MIAISDGDTVAAITEMATTRTRTRPLDARLPAPTIRVMNMLSALAPASVPIDPLEPASTVKAQVAMAVAAKVLDVQRAAGAQVVRLLDPAVGRNLDVRA